MALDSARVFAVAAAGAGARVALDGAVALAGWALHGWRGGGGEGEDGGGQGAGWGAGAQAEQRSKQLVNRCAAREGAGASNSSSMDLQWVTEGSRQHTPSAAALPKLYILGSPRVLADSRPV